MNKAILFFLVIISTLVLIRGTFAAGCNEVSIIILATVKIRGTYYLILFSLSCN